MNTLEGKTALVTGASRGIGAAIARALASAGADIALHAMSRDAEARAVAEEIRAMGRRAEVFLADFTDAAATAALARSVEPFGRIDILVNNASGPVPPRALATLSWDDVSRDLDVQVRAAFLLARSCAGPMRDAGWGRIVNVTTVYTVGAAPAQLLPYVTAKHALLGLTKALAAELGPSGITANAVAPGVTETDLIAHLPEAWKRMEAKRNPSGRLGRPEDVAAVVAFLASPAASYLNGTTVPVTGGAQ